MLHRDPPVFHVKIGMVPDQRAGDKLRLRTARRQAKIRRILQKARSEIDSGVRSPALTYNKLIICPVTFQGRVSVVVLRRAMIDPETSAYDGFAV